MVCMRKAGNEAVFVFAAREIRLRMKLSPASGA
jgi:hypothetical protein